ncbi:YciI family protein [Wenjunlia tyrosinilytica]|uniref:YCII-related domain-containing protein n=1 Tax=Wenjunlia tyrosinilytica TaxID=1544741 RepID=A0A917ZGS0_9ACTN|nr:YciI family protein [Wenjunlia tyrosinilytica]GGO81602.1 hypothetical protein GCM10012280_06260 [Wenjunlia tyrosinilytica]
MFVISLTYRVPLDQVEQHFADHMAWVERHYAEGRFLASGRKVPRTGGVILAVGADREEIEAIVAEDPFVLAAVADVGITELQVTRTSPGLEALKG